MDGMPAKKKPVKKSVKKAAPPSSVSSVIPTSSPLRGPSRSRGRGIGVRGKQGARVVEHPAVLEVRMLGYSKMKVMRTILGHLRLLVRLVALRRRGGKA